MSELHYPDLHIQGFRGFKDFEIPKLGRVNLITGKNNTGKSSLLEALYLHAQNASRNALYKVLAVREEHNAPSDAGIEVFEPDGDFYASSLFHGFPRLDDGPDPIFITTKGRTIPLELQVRAGWLVEVPDEEGDSILVEREDSTDWEHLELVGALIVETEYSKRRYPFEDLRRQARLSREPRLMPLDRTRMPTQFVKANIGETTATLESLWSMVDLTDDVEQVIDALRLIEPDISAVSMVSKDGPSKGRTAMVRAANVPYRVPLRSFGDGMNRLFAMILSLVNARGGILLIDEFENGLHYTVQFDAWRMMFSLAQKLDVQVFATTHSMDAIKAFHKASVESPELGMYLRLTRWKGGTIRLLWDEDEMELPVHASMELR